MYTLTVKSVDAVEDYKNLLKVGDTRLVKTTYQDETVIYQFMLDSISPASIIPTKISGDAKFYLSMTPNIFEAFQAQSNFDVIRLFKDDIKVDENYYLII